MRNALQGMAGFGSVYGLAVLLNMGIRHGLTVALISSLIYGLSVGTIAALWYGGLDVIQHYVLRFILAKNGFAPLVYAKFLDFATKLIFLRKVGSGYIFIHRYLMEYFASLTPADIERLTQDTPVRD